MTARKTPNEGETALFDRRGLLAGAGLLLAAGQASAQVPAGPSATAADPAAGLPVLPPDQTLLLWPGSPPNLGSRTPASGPPTQPSGKARGISTPTLGVYRPARPDGSAVIVCPGGGYAMLSMELEGSSPARRFNQDGVTVFVLTYRLPAEGWAEPAVVPLQDIQRAVRLVRARAAEFGVDPRRVGVLGFSAGGHLCASLANQHARQTYAPVDSADAQSAKPALAALIYPVVTMLPPLTYAPGLPLLLGANPSQAAMEAWSNERLVNADTPPVFIAQGRDDRLVPVENSLMMLAAMRAANRPVEAHLFQQGRHGFGIGIPGQSNQDWPRLFVAWMRDVAPAAGRS